MSDDRAELWWIPVGAGGRFVVHTSRWWEHLQAARQRRRPQLLFHAALEIFCDEHRFVIEMTPAWGQPAEASGVVSTGPVGLRMLGHFSAFQYQIRAWPEGTLPDRAHAVAPPITIALGERAAQALLAALPEVPTLTWGRQVAQVPDMWNSNSLISWLLTTVGVDAENLRPPAQGRAPGWAAGVAQARSKR